MQIIRLKDLHLGNRKLIVPKWVKWMATDESGSLWFYRLKPVKAPEHKAWVEKNTGNLNHSQVMFAGVIKPPSNWKNELYTWS